MKKMIVLVLSLFLFVGCTKGKACNVNEGMICFDEETEHYIIEDEAKLRVTVDSDAYGEALKQLWNETYPNNQDVLETIVVADYDGQSFMNVAPDVGLIYSNEAARLDHWFLPIEEKVKEEISPGLLSQYGKDVNANDFVYVPMFGYGWVFSTNKTMLKELGYSVADANQDGLLDNFDTWEKIIEWSDSQTEPVIYRDSPVDAVYNFNWLDPYEAMTYLSLDGFFPFESMKAEEPGWESETFLTTLSSLQELGAHRWNFESLQEEIDEEVSDVEKEEEDALLQESSLWNIENYLGNATSVFSLVGTWMYYEDYENLTDQDFLFSSMPSYHGYTLHPYTLSAGYVINKETAYPNACLELIRLLRSDISLQRIAELSSNPLLYNYNGGKEGDEGQEDVPILELNFPSENLRQISFAMMNGTEESMVAYSLEPKVRGWNMIYETGILNVMESVFNQEMNPIEAQNEIARLSTEWMSPYVPVEEGKEK